MGNTATPFIAVFLLLLLSAVSAASKLPDEIPPQQLRELGLAGLRPTSGLDVRGCIQPPHRVVWVSPYNAGIYHVFPPRNSYFPE